MSITQKFNVSFRMNDSRISKPLVFFIGGLALVFIVLCLPACWPDDPGVNMAVCTAPADQLHPVMASDGIGGAIIAWYDWRGGTPRVYAQHVSVFGKVQWATNGVALCTALSNQGHPAIASDGDLGAIISWHDQRGPENEVDIYAQRINKGEIQWSAEGVAICTARGTQEYPIIISDGAGGAIITWHDYRAGSTNTNIYAQRIDKSGVIQWALNGVGICTAAGLQFHPVLVSDGQGGAIITWYDKRSGHFDIYAQRINAAGVVQWTTNGLPICTASGDQMIPMIASDGIGGAIITWQDDRAGSLDSNIYAQRINASGMVQWTTNGVAICNATLLQYKPVLTSDGASGAIIAWVDNRNGNQNADIYAQRINASGTVQWLVNGVAVCTAPRTQHWGAANYIPVSAIVSDDAGGAIITWEDGRVDSLHSDIYAQRIDKSGVMQWTANGIAVSTATDAQRNPTAVVSSGGAIITWEDSRSGSNIDIYVQRIAKNGQL